MQMLEAMKLQERWGDSPCDHLSIVKEYHLGAATGEYACTKCGMTKDGSTWNKPQIESAVLGDNQ